LTWPLQFEQAIDLTDFKTTLYWKRTAEELLVATPSIELKTLMLIAWPCRVAAADGGGSPVLTLAVSVDNGNAAQAHLYFPRAQLHPHVLAGWTARSLPDICRMPTSSSRVRYVISVSRTARDFSWRECTSMA